MLPWVSPSYPPVQGRLHTRYSPVRHYTIADTVRLACVRPAASVHPEPGSNSSLCLLHSYYYILIPYLSSRNLPLPFARLRSLSSLRDSLDVYIPDFTKNFCVVNTGYHLSIVPALKWAPTYSPALAVPSALLGLTSLFGMGRGGPQSYRHLNFICLYPWLRVGGAYPLWGSCPLVPVTYGLNLLSEAVHAPLWGRYAKLSGY